MGNSASSDAIPGYEPTGRPDGGQTVLSQGQQSGNKIHNGDEDLRVRRYRRNRALLGYVVILLIYFLLLSFWQVEPVPEAVHAASVLLVAICLLPITLWYARGGQVLPMFELICLSYALQFGSAIYTQPRQLIILSMPVYLSWDSVLRALLLTLLGVVSLILGYYAAKSRFISEHLPQIDLPLHPKRRTYFLVGAFAIGSGVMLLQVLALAPSGSGPLGAIMRLLANQLNIVIILLAYQVYGDSQKHLFRTWPLYACVGIAVLLGLATGFLEGALVPLLILLIVRWHIVRKVPWRILFVSALLFILLNPVKSAYRVQVWYGESNLGLVDRITLWFDLSGDAVRDIVTGDKLGETENLARQALARFDLIHKFAYVQDLTPAFVPYYEGSTYEYLLFGWIPRFLWPDKPIASDINSRLDIDYSLVEPEQISGTTIAIGQLPEAYANFGPPGIIVVLLLQGISFAMLDTIFNGRRSDGGRAIYLAVMISFLNGIGSSTAIFFGALVQNAVANVALLRLFATGFKSKSSEEAPEQEPASRAKSPELAWQALDANR
ncbi:MAG TPA: hypothetical protein VEW94_09875 [Chloroflexia bacterium]|nr:hypothetical protein [Chloroflexia bacterium]